MAILLHYHDSKKSNKTLILSFLLAFLVSLLFPTVHSATRQLGSDSFIELQKFEMTEALFYVTTYTVNNSFRLDRFLIIFFVFCLIFYTSTFIFKKVSIQKISFLKKYFILVGLLMFVYLNFNAFKMNSFLFEKLSNNFNQQLRFNQIQVLNDDLKVIVYIGESTSSLNMSLYGYHRKTTPNLDKLLDLGLIQYKGVLSNHTHTTQSLLESLSIPVLENKIETIFDKKRYPITSLLERSKIQTFLYSNQGQSGSFNLASPIIFKDSETHFSVNSTLAANNDKKLEKPFDHDYFIKSLDTHFNKSRDYSEVIFLHSYAGHGAYLKFIPKEFHQKIDHFYSTNSIQKTLKIHDKNLVKVVEDYDSAIKYIDYSLTKVFDFTETKNTPIVTIYFSDHGDSAFDNSGHDSTRANLATFNIPFLIYFNQAARQKYPSKYAYFKKLAEDNFSLLDQFPRTLIDLFDINIRSLPETLIIPAPIGSGDISHAKAFFVREKNDGLQYISTNSDAFNRDNFGDSLIGTFIINRQKKVDSLLCMHATNNLESKVKGKAIGNCLEFDLVINKNKLSIYHPPAKDSNFLINEMINSESKKLSFWIDAKNLDNPNNCEILFSFLMNNKANYKNVMVEFPTKTDVFNQKIMQCASNLRKESIDISYYIDTAQGKLCIKEDNQNACKLIERQIKQLKNQNIFNNISYDKKLIKLIDRLDEERFFAHNTWSFQPDEISNVKPAKFKRIIYENK